MKNHTLSRNLLVATLTLATVPASAGVVIYTDPTAWQAALASGTTTTGVTFGSNVAGIFQSSYTTAGLTFTGNPYIYGSGTSSTLFGDYYLFGLGSVTINIPSAANLYGFGVYEACSANCGLYPNQVSATSTTQASTILSSTNVSWQQNSTKLFFGFVSDSPITSINFTSNSGQVPNIVLGNITEDTGSPTSEVTTLILIGTGLGLMARFRRHLTYPIH